jgi:hypothetical protein
MTISWRRCTQPENAISRNASRGGTEPMPEVYRTRRSSFWTARDSGFMPSLSRSGLAAALRYLFGLQSFWWLRYTRRGGISQAFKARRSHVRQPNSRQFTFQRKNRYSARIRGGRARCRSVRRKAQPGNRQEGALMKVYRVVLKDGARCAFTLGRHNRSFAAKTSPSWSSALARSAASIRGRSIYMMRQAAWSASNLFGKISYQAD